MEETPRPPKRKFELNFSGVLWRFCNGAPQAAAAGAKGGVSRRPGIRFGFSRKTCTSQKMCEMRGRFATLGQRKTGGFCFACAERSGRARGFPTLHLTL